MIETRPNTCGSCKHWLMRSEYWGVCRVVWANSNMHRHDRCQFFEAKPEPVDPLDRRRH